MHMIRGRPDPFDVLPLDCVLSSKPQLFAAGETPRIRQRTSVWSPAASAGVLTNEPPEGFAHSDMYFISLRARSLKCVIGLGVYSTYYFKVQSVRWLRLQSY